MRKTIIRVLAMTILLTGGVATTSSCNRHDCPAMDGGYRGKTGRFIKKTRRKPESGLWKSYDAEQRVKQY